MTRRAAALVPFAILTLVAFVPASAGQRPRCFSERATIVGTAGDDVIVGTGHRDYIAALRGDDVIRGRGGNDFVCAGPGRDVINGQAGNDNMTGEEGKDLFVTSVGNDVYLGGPHGRFPGDTVSFAPAPRRIRSDLDFGGGGSGEGFASGHGSDVLFEVESAVGSRFSDRIGGSTDRNVLVGGRGSDRLHGEQRGDRLFGRQGPDELLGQGGRDFGNGGGGTDTCETEVAVSCEAVP
jgi:Ca2+-binding RTX toxin-like protein